MRLRLIGVTAAMAIAAPALADPNASGAPVPADSHVSVPAPPAHAMAVPGAMPARHGATVYEHLVDINSASRQELMTLPGIGKAEADRIIKNRPYLVKTDLVGKNVLPVGPFLSIKYRVVAMPTAEVRAKLR